MDHRLDDGSFVVNAMEKEPSKAPARWSEKTNLNVKTQNKSLLVLIFGKEAPSTRFRWLDFRPLFESEGWKIVFKTLSEMKDFSSLEEFDIVVLQKTMVSGAVLHHIRRYAKRLIYDADDRIWMRPGRPYRGLTRWKIGHRMRAICDQVDLCLAANSHIAEDLSKFGAKQFIIPMALDPKLWIYQAPREKMPVIGWTGGPKNLLFLEVILPVLHAVLRQHDCLLRIHCGEDPGFSKIAYEYVPFEAGEESNVVRDFDIGLCPLPDDSFSCGKSPIKVLQYLASGAAVVASPHGAVQDFLAAEQTGLWAENAEAWQTQLCRLITGVTLRNDLARQGRNFM